MARHDDTERPVRRVGLMMARRLGKTILALSGMAFAQGCASFDPAGDNCELLGREPCTPIGGGSAGQDALPDAAEERAWGCLGRTPAELPAPRPPTMPVAFVAPVVEWGSLAPLAGQGLVASLCPTTDFACPTPLAPRYSVVAGSLGGTTLPAQAAGVPVYEGFDGFIKFEMVLPPGTAENLQYLPETYYLGGRVSGDLTNGPPLLMVQANRRDTILQQSFGSVIMDPLQAQTGGTVVIGVFDCSGLPVNDARVEIDVPGVPFLLPATRIPIAKPIGDPLYTEASGIAGFLNIRAGGANGAITVQARAFRRGEMQPFAVGELGAVAGQISVASLRPPFLNSANLSGAPAIEETDETP
jgi:hypothetical protein